MLHTITTLRRLLLTAAIALLCAAPALAQSPFEEDATAGGSPAAAAPAAAPGGNPAAPAATSANAAALADYGRRDPIIAAALALPRDTPAKKLQTVFTLLDLGHADVAALILPDVIAAKLDDAQLADLVRQFGSARFMTLIRLDAPQAKDAKDAKPGALAGAREFAQKCLDAAAAVANDPARLSKIVQQLNDADEGVRYAARVDLRATGDAGIMAAMTALAGAKMPTPRANLLAALAELRPEIDAPLVAVLAEGRGKVRADAATLALQLHIHDAMPWLATISASQSDPLPTRIIHAAFAKIGAPAPTAEEAQALLRHELTELEAAPLLGADDVRDRWWTWDGAKNQLAAADYTPRQLRVLARARLASALAEAGGVAPADRRQGLADAIEVAELLGRDVPPNIKQMLAAMKPGDVTAALAAAVSAGRFGAATQLAADLGARKDASVLATADGRPSPLAAAADSNDRQLRYAALAAIMQLAPQHTFPGASAVPRALWFFASGAGEPTVVTAAPVFSRASDWAGQLRAHGYDATPAATGRTALEAALDRSNSSRLAAVVLDSDIDYPQGREVIFQLRQLPRTANVPVVVASSTEHYAMAQRIAEADPLVLVAPRPHGEGALAELVDRAVALSPRPMAEAKDRTAQAAQALAWLAKLLTDGSPYDELRRDAELADHALFVPELTEHAIRVLGAVGTANSQSTLIDFASSRTAPIDGRRAAAAALAASFQRFGIQLTSQQLLTQYDRYNASETADADTQKVLGGILDSLEKNKRTHITR